MPQFGTLGRVPSIAERSFTGSPIEVIASASTIAPQGGFVRVTGNTTISTITAPRGIIGPLYIFNTDSSVGVTDTNGNIALATTLTRYKVFTFIYDRSTALWYPSATS